jgi:hypothetical protein
MTIGGTITSATEGSILFAGASGVLAQDNANFFWDNTNNRLGLGTTTPSKQLSIFGASNALQLAYDVSNYANIATSSAGVLSIATSNTAQSQLVIGNNSAVNTSILFDESITDYYVGNDSATGYFTIGVGTGPGTGDLLSLDSSGNTYLAAGNFQFNVAGQMTSANNITPDSVLDSGASDEYCLTYEATGFTWEWQACGVGIGDTITSATSGSLLFAGTSGILAQDNANLFWDNTNDRLGIGTITPASLLDITGGLTTTGSVLTLGTKEPSVVAADVLGRLNFYAPLESDGSDSRLVGASIAAIAEGTFGTTLNATSLQFQTGNSETATTKMTILSSGNVGIGDTTPASLFTVGNGDLFQVSSSGAIAAVTDIIGATGNINFTNFDVLGSSGNTDIGGTITAGSGNEIITLSTGKIDADALTLTAAVDGGTGTSSGSGLMARSDGIGLLQGCADGQVLKWIESTDTWDCATITPGGTSKFVVKGSDENVASGTTLQDDNELTFPVASGETWVFDFVLRVSNVNSATPGWKNAIKGATGWTCAVTMSGTEPAGAAFPQANMTDCDGTPTSVANTTIVADANVPYQVRVQGFVTTTSSGSVVLQWAANTSGSLTVKAGSYVIAQKVGGSDLAEVYYTKDPSIGPGDVVSLDKSIAAGVQKSTKAYDSQAFGIVSTRPGLLLGDGTTNTEDRPVQVALAGRVPTQVNTENGPIQPGDLLTTSSTPGVAMRATKAGQVIGQAMTPFDGEGVGSVLAFIKTDVTTGSSLADRFRGVTLSQDGTDIGKRALEELLAENISTQPASQISDVMTDRVVAGLEVVTPRVTADVAALNKIEAATGLDIDVSLAEGGSLNIGNVLGEKGITFDAAGNATFKGTVVAGTIAAEKILGLEIFTDKISSIGEDTSELEQKIRILMEAQKSQNMSIAETENGLVIARDASFEGEAFFQKFVTFAGNVLFRGEVSFEKVPTFSKDTAGYAVIAEGADRVRVEFEEEYAYPPIVNASLALETIDNEEVRDAAEELLLVSEVKYIVTNVTTKGFEIRINQGVFSDVRFSWQALAVKDAKTSLSQDTATGSEPIAPEEVSGENDNSGVPEEGETETDSAPEDEQLDSVVDENESQPPQN